MIWLPLSAAGTDLTHKSALSLTHLPTYQSKSNVSLWAKPHLNPQIPTPLNVYMYMYFKYYHLTLVSRCNSITGVTNCLNGCKDGMSLVLDMEIKLSRRN